MIRNSPENEVGLTDAMKTTQRIKTFTLKESLTYSYLFSVPLPSLFIGRIYCLVELFTSGYGSFQCELS